MTNQNRLLKFLGKSLQKHLVKLRTESKNEAQFSEYGLKREPWEKYFLLDSQKFLPLLLSREPLGMVEQMIVVHFIVFALNEGGWKFFIRMSEINLDFFDSTEFFSLMIIYFF